MNPIAPHTPTLPRRRIALPGAMLVLAALTLAGCARTQPSPPPSHTTLALPPARPEPYVLAVGDELSIKFYKNPDLNEERTIVRPDGMISMQLVGDVRAAGLTPAALTAELTHRYEGELADPKISVMVRKLGGHRIFVGGEVGKQGVLPLSGGLTLYQAIQEAGGFLTTAHRRQVVLIRRAGGGQPAGYSFDARDVQNGTHPERDVLLQPLDVVFVPRSEIANLDLFVEQYIRNLLPITPGFAVGPF